MARKQWRCFHCDGIYTRRKDACNHFGFQCDAIPACQIKSHEGHLITYIRRLEEENARHRQDDSDVMRSIMTLEADHQAALRESEERGYEKGVRDMQAQGYCTDPQAHAITKAA